MASLIVPPFAALFSSSLILPCPWHQQVLERLIEVPGVSVALRVGLARRPDGSEQWLVQEVLPDLRPLAQPGRGERFFLVRSHEGGGRLLPYVESDLELHPSAVVGELFLGDGPWRGKTWGFVRSNDGTRYRPLDWLVLPGAEMSRMSLLARDAGRELEDVESVMTSSRTAGALGPWPEGARVLQRMRSTHYLLSGVSRNGMFMAEWLARLGAAHVTLCDPKPLRSEHLGEISGLLLRDDLGRPKAEAAAERLRPLLRPSTTFRTLIENLASRAGAVAARDADVLIDCGDNDAMRLASGILAVSFHKVQLSVASGVHFDTAGNRVMGADVRLLLPGSRCLLCCGGVTDYDRAVLTLSTGEQPGGESPEAWRHQRAGSLRSLNQITTGVAAMLLENLFAGRIHESRWVRLECDRDGHITTREPDPGPASTDCDLCKRAGAGDAGIGWVNGVSGSKD